MKIPTKLLLDLFEPPVGVRELLADGVVWGTLLEE
jgi:hypothetical protein